MATSKWSLTKHNTLVCDSKEVLSIFPLGITITTACPCVSIQWDNEYDFGNTSHLKIEDNFHVYLFYIRVVALDKIKYTMQLPSLSTIQTYSLIKQCFPPGNLTPHISSTCHIRVHKSIWAGVPVSADSFLIVCSFFVNEFIHIHWYQIGRGGASNHQPRECLLNRLIRCIKNIKASLATGDVPAQRVSSA